MSGESASFVDELCKRRMAITVIFIISLVFLAVQLPYLILAESGSALYTISVMNLVGLILFTTGSGWVLWTCRGRVV